MGVLGLTSFIEKNAQQYLAPIQLKGSYLIVDGNCIASHLYVWRCRKDSAFGGDYEEYYVTVRHFFSSILKCNITPIVVFDGGFEEIKLKTVLSRLETKLRTVKVSFNSGYSKTKIFPLFMKNVFLDALEGLGICCVQTEFEADREIAALAKKFDCPVLSYDSDFFIFDVLYIPFSTVELEIIKINGMDGEEYGIPCSIYNIDNFLQKYPGLERFHLPIISTLLGNDYVDSDIFVNFFKQIPSSNLKHCSFSQKKVHGLLNWLRHESEASAIKKITMHISKSCHEKMLTALQISKDNYALKCNFIINEDDKKRIVSSACQTSLDKNIWMMLSQCKLPRFILDMITLNSYFLTIQVEKIAHESSHTLSLNIIKAIYRLIHVNHSHIEPLTVFIRDRSRIKRVVLETDTLSVTLNQLLSSSTASRRLFLLNTLDLTPSDVPSVDGFPIEHQLFLSCFINWTKSNIPSDIHAHALLLSYFACQANTNVGFFKCGKEAQFSGKQVHEFNHIFFSNRKTSDVARLNFKVEIVHVFNIFQSILYHASVLNVLLRSPLKTCKVVNSFYGTLAYNLYIELARQSNTLNYIQKLLSPVPEIALVYGKYWDQVSKFCQFVPKGLDKKISKTKKKLKAKSKSWHALNASDSDGDCDKEEDDISYEDIGNKFYLLNVQNA